MTAGCATSHTDAHPSTAAVDRPLARASQSAVKQSQRAPAAPARPLYDRLGGAPALDAVVTEFLKTVAADERINAPFAMADLDLLHRRLVEFFCYAAGGGCTYTGRDMKASHRGMHVTQVQFDALVGDLVQVFDKFKVPAQEKGEVLAALGPLQAQIVEAE